MEKIQILLHVPPNLCGNSSLGCDYTDLKKSPGLHYNHLGEAKLHNTEWKIITYINLHDAGENFRAVKDHAHT